MIRIKRINADENLKIPRLRGLIVVAEFVTQRCPILRRSYIFTGPDCRLQHDQLLEKNFDIYKFALANDMFVAICKPQITKPAWRCDMFVAKYSQLYQKFHGFSLS